MGQRFELVWVASLLTLVLTQCGDDDDDEGPGADTGADMTGDLSTDPATDPVADSALDVTLPTTCEELVNGFSACGGEVIGSWSLDRWCWETSPFTSPLAETEGCEDIVMEGQVTAVSGTFTFNGDGSGTRTIDLSMEASLDLHETCLSALSAGMGTSEQTCSVMNTNVQDDGGTCEWTGTLCACDFAQGQTDDVTLTWERSGNQLLITDEGDEEPSTVDYCVQGTSVTWSSEEETEEGDTFTWYGQGTRL